MDASSGAPPNNLGGQDINSSRLAQPNVAQDGLRCEWQGCTESYASPEHLYVSSPVTGVAGSLAVKSLGVFPTKTFFIKICFASIEILKRNIANQIRNIFVTG
jgi:hypothetical protein